MSQWCAETGWACTVHNPRNGSPWGSDFSKSEIGTNSSSPERSHTAEYAQLRTRVRPVGSVAGRHTSPKISPFPTLATSR